MPRSLRSVAVLAWPCALLTALAGCAADPCAAALAWSRACAAKASRPPPTANLAACRASYARCTAAEQAALADAYDCFTARSACDLLSAEAATCLTDLPASTATCVLRGCRGRPADCATLATPSLCASGHGCAWTAGACAGTRTDTCSGADEPACTAVQGCSWTP